MMLFDIFGYQLTMAEIVLGLISAVLLIGSLVSAIKDIHTDGWGPFKTRLLSWRKRKHRKIVDALAGKFDERFDQIDRSVGNKLEEIKRELTTNGGSSLKDHIVEIGGALQNIQARIDHQDETSPQPIFHLDENGQMSFANAAFREMVDAEEQDLVHQNYLSRVDAGDRRRLDEEIKDAIVKKMPFDVTVRFRRSGLNDGVFVRMQATPNVRPGGQLLGYFGTAAEIEMKVSV